MSFAAGGRRIRFRLSITIASGACLCTMTAGYLSSSFSRERRLGWDTILQKRENYRVAFDGFDPAKVARYGGRKVGALLGDEGIVRNRLKIASAISNARAFLEVQKEFGSFDRYIWQFVGGKPRVNARRLRGTIPARTVESDAMSKDLRKRGFNFVGSTICYAFMQATGMVNDHAVECFRYGAALG